MKEVRIISDRVVIKFDGMGGVSPPLVQEKLWMGAKSLLRQPPEVIIYNAPIHESD
jgi:hypothetical protein